MKKTIFLDKDGTVIRNVPYNVDPGLVSLLPGVGEGLRALQAAGYKFVVVTNQAGIALGHFSEVDLMRAMRRLWALLAAEDVYPLASYYCPHAVEGTVAPYARACTCRKPQPGLLLRAARDLEIPLADSWMIGDILNDVEAGRRAGCRTILVDNGNETERVVNQWRKPDHTVFDLPAAAEIILHQRIHHVRTSIL
jgi:D,D-heptose 1,7-bisphosphate phosphatase